MMLTLLEKQLKHLQMRRTKTCHQPGGEGWAAGPKTRWTGCLGRNWSGCAWLGSTQGRRGSSRESGACRLCGLCTGWGGSTCQTGLRDLKFAAGLALTLLHDAHACLPFAAKAPASLLPAEVWALSHFQFNRIDVTQSSQDTWHCSVWLGP